MTTEEREANEEWDKILRKHIASLHYILEACKAHQRLKAGQPVADKLQVN